MQKNHWILFRISLEFVTKAPIDGQPWCILSLDAEHATTQIARFMWPTWGPPGIWRPQVGFMLAPWIAIREALCEPAMAYFADAYMRHMTDNVFSKGSISNTTKGGSTTRVSRHFGQDLLVPIHTADTAYTSRIQFLLKHHLITILSWVL